MKDRKDLSCIFRPRSVAVLGASARPGAIGREVVKNLINFEFQGKVFLVNPGHDVVLSMKAYPSVTDIPDPVDLAVIVVPGPQVLEVVKECGDKGVKGLVIITAGFREIGGEGANMEAELAAEIDRRGMVAVGPNSVGVMNADPAVRLNASFISTVPKPGNVALPPERLLHLHRPKAGECGAPVPERIHRRNNHRFRTVPGSRILNLRQPGQPDERGQPPPAGLPPTG